jgi:tol-pal system protein YbgF
MKYPRQYGTKCRTIRRSFRRVSAAFVVLSISFFTSLLSIPQMSYAREPAPVIEGTLTLNIEQRLAIIERKLDNQALIELITKLDNMQKEMQSLVGNMEVQTHNIGSMKKRQRDLYADIDRRLQQAEKELKAITEKQKAIDAGLASSSARGSFSGSVSQLPPGAAASVSAVDTKLERQAYQRAFNLLKDGRYELAIASFKAFIETFPGSRDVDYAQYWLGDANYVQERYDAAIVEFQKVLDKYPNSKKIPDTLLRMGFT